MENAIEKNEKPQEDKKPLKWKSAQIKLIGETEEKVFTYVNPARVEEIKRLMWKFKEISEKLYSR